MKVRVSNQTIELPEMTLTVENLITNLGLLGIVVNTADEVRVNNDVISDRNITIPENSTIEFVSLNIKVTKGVGSFFENEIPYEAMTIKEAITKALEPSGIEMVFTDQIQVIDYSNDNTVIYTLSQLNEPVKAGAILKVVAYGKDTSGR